MNYTILFLTLYTSLCFSQNNGTHKIIIKEGFGIANIAVIGESKALIKKRHGKSDLFYITKTRGHIYTDDMAHKSKVTTVSKYGRSKNIYYYNKLELYIGFGAKDTVNSIYFTSDKYETSKGLRVGDSREKAYKLYREGNSPILLCHEEGIDIVFDCNVVKEIRIYKPY